MQTYITVDLETTGFSALSHEIIEIGAWKVVDGVVKDKFTTLVRPYGYVSREIQNITGITFDMLKDEETVQQVLPEFFEWCGDMPFLGHNLSFDYGFLVKRGQDIGLDFSLKGQRQGICTLKLSRKYLGSLPSHKLEDVATHYNIMLDQSRGGYHRAAYDSYVTKLVYDRFVLGYPTFLDVQMPELLSVDDKKYGKVVNNNVLSFD